MSVSKTYFGAANGYSGFRSNFTGIFSPNMYEKIFIIKGGPGTGKSTLMRRIEESYRKKYDTTVMLCSSDPDSYDGVIVEKGGKRVALVDGTSPHVVEPMYPGAVEEIVNLGDSFDYERLHSHRNEILTLSDSKRAAYKQAYDTLSIAGSVHKCICDNLPYFYSYNLAERLFGDIVKSQSSGVMVCEKAPYLIGSFSKSGYRRVDKIYHKKKEISVGGDGISEYILLSELARWLEKKGISYTIFASPFSVDIPDMIETQDTVFVKAGIGDFILDSNVLVSLNESYFRLYKAYQFMLESSKQALDKASEYHFALESIYSNAVRFSDNEKQYDRIIESIERILDK